MIRHVFAPLLFAVFLSSYVTRCSSGEPDMVQRFKTQCAAFAQDAEKNGTMSVVGKQDWLFFGPELRHLSLGPFWGEQAAKVSKATKPKYADPLPAILDFNNQLKKSGIELIVLPVPLKAVIYPDFLSDTISASKAKVPLRVDNVHQAFYEILKTNGVEVLDLTSLFLANRFHPKGALYCQQDSHWSGNACVLASKFIADELRTRSWFGAIPKRAFTNEWMKVTISGDLWKSLGNENLPKEQLLVRRVGTASATGIEPVEPDKSSPVLLLGDSHDLVFHVGGDMHVRGAGLADQLAFELGFPVDLVAVRGSGATPARINLFRRARKTPGYWAGKKAVIWCFSAREFTESDGWRKVPIAP